MDQVSFSLLHECQNFHTFQDPDYLCMLLNAVGKVNIKEAKLIQSQTAHFKNVDPTEEHIR